MKTKIFAKSILILAFSFNGSYGLSSSDEKINSTKLNPVVVLDWDDTILPTSKIHDGINSTQEKKLRELDEVAYDFIRSFWEQNIPVIVVSNGSGGWLKQSAEKYLPRTNRLFCSTNDEITCAPFVSAKDYFEGKFPTLSGLSITNINNLAYQTPMLWKYEFFKDKLSSYNSVFSVGDGIAEQYAMKHVFSKTPSFHISLPVKPDIDTIKKNLQYIQASYSYITSHSQSNVLTGCDMKYIYGLFDDSSKNDVDFKLMQVKLLIRNQSNVGYLISRIDFLAFIKKLDRIEKTLFMLNNKEELLSMPNILSELEAEISSMPKFTLASEPSIGINPIEDFVDDIKENTKYDPSMKDIHQKASYVLKELSKFLVETESVRFSEYLKSYTDERGVNLYKEAQKINNNRIKMLLAAPEFDPTSEIDEDRIKMLLAAPEFDPTSDTESGK